MVNKNQCLSVMNPNPGIPVPFPTTLIDQPGGGQLDAFGLGIGRDVRVTGFQGLEPGGVDHRVLEKAAGIGKDLGVRQFAPPNRHDGFGHRHRLQTIRVHRPQVFLEIPIAQNQRSGA